MAGSVLNSTAALRLNICTKLNICALISATSPSRKPLCGSCAEITQVISIKKEVCNSQKIYKAEAWKLESSTEVGKLESDNKQTKNRNVKVGICQQKLEKQKCESWNLPTENRKVFSWNWNGKLKKQ